MLLKNDDGVLPLERTTPSIAVVGPLANSTDLHGTWAGPGGFRLPSVSILDAVRTAAPGARVTHAGDDIAAAVAAAQGAEVTVVVVGEPPALSGEAAVRSDIALPRGQEELIAAVAATGKPYAVVLLNGRPLTIGGWLDTAPAVLEAWHPGIEAGHAVADVLFGTVNPGGKLPVTFPRSVGQIPVYYNHENTGRPYDPQTPDEHFRSRYLDLPQGPRLPFGHGLSYTSFSVSGPRLSRETISTTALLDEGETVEVTVTVTNTGDCIGDEVVQLYVHDAAASIAQPVRRLRGFERVTLAPGASTTVTSTSAPTTWASGRTTGPEPSPSNPAASTSTRARARRRRTGPHCGWCGTDTSARWWPSGAAAASRVRCPRGRIASGSPALAPGPYQASAPRQRAGVPSSPHSKRSVPSRSAERAVAVSGRTPPAASCSASLGPVGSGGPARLDRVGGRRWRIGGAATSGRVARHRATDEEVRP